MGPNNNYRLSTMVPLQKHICGNQSPSGQAALKPGADIGEVNEILGGRTIWKSQTGRYAVRLLDNTWEF
jgi:hypothetical protein